MAKRQTETKIWTNERWFKKLHPYHKLVWKYLLDSCDHAGIWKIDYGQLVDDTGIEDFDLDAFIEACNMDFDKLTGKRIFRERLIVVDGAVLWITGFIQFQYEGKTFEVAPDVPVVKSALTILMGYGILQEGLDKGYITLSKPFGIVQKPSEPVTEQKSDAKTPPEGAIEPENSPPNPTITPQNPSEPLLNPLEGLDKGGERLKIQNTKNKEQPPVEPSGSSEDSQQGNPEEGKKGPPEREWERDVGLCWNAVEYFESHQAVFESLCIAHNARYTALQIKDIIEKYHLWTTKKEEYPQKPAQIRAGVTLWLKNEKNFVKNESGKPAGSPNGKSAGTVELADKLAKKLAAAGNPNPAG